MKNNFKIIKYIIIVIITILLYYIWVWLYYIIWYNSYHNHMKPFEHLSITQTGSYIKFWGASLNGNDKWTIIIEEDSKRKKIFLKYINNSKKLDLYYYFNSEDYIWYEMCYKNDYWEYCFWRIK